MLLIICECFRLSVFVCHRRSTSACVSPLADCETAGNTHNALETFSQWLLLSTMFRPFSSFFFGVWEFAPAKVTKGLTAKYEIKVAQPSAIPEEKPPTVFLRPWFRSKHNSTDYLNLSDAAVKQGRRRARPWAQSRWTVDSPQVLQQIAFLWRGLKRSLRTGRSFKSRCQVSVLEREGGGGVCVCGRGHNQEGTRSKVNTGPWVFYVWGRWRVELAAPAAEQRESDETKRFISSQQLPNNCAKLKLWLENVPGDWTKACRENCDGKIFLAVKVTWHICQQ